jgi:hypothetical protein
MWTDRQTDRQTDIMRLTVAFGNFVNMPKKGTESVAETVRQDIKCQIKQLGLSMTLLGALRYILHIMF